ncbi:MAG: carboxypeptidase M32 [Saprospiraceae bacterium]|nr:carboxypeptidase M32 [Saprospiraceae bacterium]
MTIKIVTFCNDIEQKKLKFDANKIPPTMTSSYASYQALMQKIADLSNAIAVMSWDNEVNLPEASGPLRARQIATLAALSHEMFTAKTTGKLLSALTLEKLPFKKAKNIALTLRDYQRDKKFSPDFVMQKSLVISQAYHAWNEAKKKDDFAVFAPRLDELIRLVKEEAEILGYEQHAYDAMLELYEPGIRVEKLDQLFQGVTNELVPFIKGLDPQWKAKPGFLSLKYDKDSQWKFGLEVLKGMGYDFKRGRQDISSHPFTISFGTEDVRVTTRIDERDFSNMTWSCIHEGGHALYEQGLDAKEYGLPSGSAASLGIHESQSRLWENNLGRSKVFWQHFLPVLKKYFPSQLKGVRLDDFYIGINHVSKNTIRTEADELHYHLHVAIRYELEKEIFSSNIKAKDLRQLWNEKYKKYLGVNIKNDREGILQDVHWSHGSFGYFPTYSLGSFYAAQFFSAMQNEYADLDKQVAEGDFSSVHNWLKKNIYRHGKTYNAEELCRKATGSTLDFQYFMSYIKNKYQRK